MFADLDGKTVLVAGAAGGLGEAQVRKFHEAGANVVIADLAEDKCKHLSDELGGRTLAVPLDVSDEEGWGRAVEAAEAEFGPVDVLVSTFGVAPQSELESMPLRLFMDTVAVNQVGVFLGMKAVIPSMKKAGAGSIINVSSSGAYSPRPRLLAYAGSKAAVVAMTKSAALELGQLGIRVNCVCPGAFETPLRAATAAAWQAANPDAKTEQAFESYPLGRLGRPDELANLVLFLASGVSSYCTGAMFLADGGRLAGTTNYRKQQ
jgi:3alpha(or 20beta)-hydroxysteroid dehydrogenase